ncbi:diguanylate cyclase domain-containing protein [Pseudoalteromonas sp.]|uniref:diguanylate cyclase domain-containing protein n=1 Tax=Pseudoalteromonas sp. TaxID=53249 RepID=UPI003561FCEF
MIDGIKQQIRKRMFWDLISLLLLFVASYIFFLLFNVIDWLHQWSHEIAISGIAEIIPALCVLVFGFSIFSYRRWQDTRALSLYAEELSMIDPMTNLPNRRAVQRILNQINQKKEYPVGVLLVNIEGLENIRSTLGHNVLEHVMIEILYHISKHLTGEQLVAYWQAGQFVCLCPGLEYNESENLKQQFETISINRDKLIGQSLKFSCAASSVYNKAELENLFSELEEQLI